MTPAASGSTSARIEPCSWPRSITTAPPATARRSAFSTRSVIGRAPFARSRSELRPSGGRSCGDGTRREPVGGDERWWFDSSAHVHHVRTPGVEAAADGGAAGDGMSPGARCAAACAAAPDRAPESPTAAPRCTGARRRVDRVGGPSSTMRPRYITAMRSLTWRTTARSCAMNRYAIPRRPAGPEQVDDLGLGRDVERAHRLVEHHQLAVRARAPGDRRSAAADRPRARAGSGRARPASRPTRPIKLTGAIGAARCPRARAARASVRAARRATVALGSNDEYGSWNTSCMLAAQRAQLASRARSVMSRAVEGSCRRWGRAAAAPGGRASTCPSPTRRRGPTVVPGATARSTPSTAWTCTDRASGRTPALDREVLRDAARFDDGRVDRAGSPRRAHRAPERSSSVRDAAARTAVGRSRNATASLAAGVDRRTRNEGGTGTRSASCAAVGTTPAMTTERRLARRPTLGHRPRADPRCTGGAGP